MRVIIYNFTLLNTRFPRVLAGLIKLSQDNKTKTKKLWAKIKRNINGDST